MKVFIKILFLFVFFAVAAENLPAQSRTVTLILFRHAEKDLSLDPNDPDPELSAAGKARAERLFEILKKYKPDAIYSSNYKRTRATVLPAAENLDPKYRLMIRLYDHRKLNEFVDRLYAENSRVVAVAGHNTTTPALANLLIGEEKYKPLLETEYDKIFIVKLKRKKGKTVKVEQSVITY